MPLKTNCTFIQEIKLIRFRAYSNRIYGLTIQSTIISYVLNFIILGSHYIYYPLGDMASTNTSPFEGITALVISEGHLTITSKESARWLRRSQHACLGWVVSFPYLSFSKCTNSKIFLNEFKLEEEKSVPQKKGSFYTLITGEDNQSRLPHDPAIPLKIDCIYILHKTLQNVHRRIISNRENLEINVMLNKKIHK